MTRGVPPAAAAQPARPAPAPRGPAAAAGTMLTATTPSTHDGRLNDLPPPGVEGGELTGEMVMSSGAEPLSCDDDARPSSRDLPAVVPPRPAADFLLLRLRLKCRCSQLPRDVDDDLELSARPPAKSGSLVHLSCSNATQPL